MIKRFGKEEIDAVSTSIKKASLLSGYTNKFLGSEILQKFEKEFAKFHNCRYGISVNSGTSALFVSQLAASKKNNQNVAVPSITFSATTSQVIAANNPKGDVLSISRIAGIMAAKRTPELIPLCHQIDLNHVEITIDIDEVNSRFIIQANTKSNSKTGVEMESLVAVSITALTIYDMTKAIDHDSLISDIQLVSKKGGKSGDISRKTSF